MTERAARLVDEVLPRVPVRQWVLACPRCGGRLRLIATIDDPDAIRAVLAASAVSRELADRAPPFAPPVDTSHGAALSA
jgi:hypothetical protein